MTYFDIETASIPLADLEKSMPEFEAAANLKDPAKIAANIQAKRDAWIRDAALDATTGQILCIGIYDELGFSYLGAGNEKSLLRNFWLLAESVLLAEEKLIGFNCNSFDLPFLIRRSWHHGIKPPAIIRSGRFWNANIVDLREVWQLGDRQAVGGLDAVSRFLGLEGKSGSGKDFAAIWESDRAAALKYLETDLLLKKKLAEIMI
jgi:predicted PolB exonuclease-like 3'-5' exonuclease